LSAAGGLVCIGAVLGVLSVLGSNTTALDSERASTQSAEPWSEPDLPGSTCWTYPDLVKPQDGLGQAYAVQRRACYRTDTLVDLPLPPAELAGSLYPLVGVPLLLRDPGAPAYGDAAKLADVGLDEAPDTLDWARR
jgi:hypothetical protein